MATFSAQIDSQIAKIERLHLAIFKESTQRMSSLMQSRIPVDTGFARASHRASLTSMPKIDEKASKPTPGSHFSWNPTSVSVVIAQAKIGDKIYLGWTANYVPELERGHSRQAPSGFIRVSLLEWPRIVSEVTAAAKSRSVQ